jgi:hypothetical protein
MYGSVFSSAFDLVWWCIAGANFTVSRPARVGRARSPFPHAQCPPACPVWRCARTPHPPHACPLPPFAAQTMFQDARHLPYDNWRHAIFALCWSAFSVSVVQVCLRCEGSSIANTTA